MKQAVPLVLLLVAAGGRIAAQAEPPGVPSDRSAWSRGLVHYGKWATAAAAVTLTALGAHEHSHSTREWDQLLAICRANNADCALGSDGRYLNPAAEALYQTSLHFDRRARARLLAGQASLLVTAGLFFADLRRRSSGPENIPLHPFRVSADPTGGGAHVGVRIAF